MTTEELMQQKVTAAKVAAAGASIALWQVFLFFVMGKALHSMWVLINTL